MVDERIRVRDDIAEAETMLHRLKERLKVLNSSLKEYDKNFGSAEKKHKKEMEKMRDHRKRMDEQLRLYTSMQFLNQIFNL
jgi:predicted  nucleic acid-binding Zn-ribbon protein